MFKRTQVSRALAIAFGGAIVMAATPALSQQEAPKPPEASQEAQKQEPPKSDAQRLERVEITGSRIKTVQTEGTSAVVILSAEAIKAEGVRSVEQLLNNLPQVVADYGGSVSNGSTGTATVDLRNLGRNRTLVLVNGRRMPAGSPREVAADLNQIPISLIKRVEILTGGASAIYGSDAIAGVVNFILDDKFKGIQVDLNHSFYNHQQHNKVADVVSARGFALPGDKSADGKVNDINLTMGSEFADNKGSAAVFLGYKREDALLQSERDFSACSLAPAGSIFACGGSSTSFPGRFITASNGSRTVADVNGGTRAWTAARDIYNFGPLNYFQRPSERYTFSALANYNVTEKAKVYTEISFHDDSTVAQIAPSGLFGFDASGANAIRFENPLLSADWKRDLGLVQAGDTAAVTILRRNVEGGGRQDDIRHTSYRSVLGIKGEEGSWNYDAFAQVGRVVFQETYKNDFSIARTARAMNVVTDPTTGQPVCQSKLDGTDKNCVPYNIWKLGGVTQDALAYLQTPGFQKGFTSLGVFGATLGADLGDYGIKLPDASTGVGINFGVERRTEKLDLSTDAAFTTGDLAGQGGPTLSVGGEYTVNDIYGELRVPILERQPFAELLNFDASYRRSKYSTGAKTDTYGSGLEWKPTKDFKLRTSYQRAVRAPNVVELFRSPALGLYNNDPDPCAGDLDPLTTDIPNPTASREECARTGVTDAQYGTILDNPAGQYNGLFGGDRNLRPETSDSYAVGLVLTPARDLGITVDYFKIKVVDVISSIDPTTTLSKCLATGDPFFCSLIQRDSRGTLWLLPDAQIKSIDTNLGSYFTEGIDLGADYSTGISGFGRVAVSFLGTFVHEFSIEEIKGQGSYDCVGLYGSKCGAPQPGWRHKLRVTWTAPSKLETSLTWRHLDSVDVETSSANPLLNNNGDAVVNAISRTFGARDYLDVSASYPIGKSFTVRGSINNFFDRDPPLSNPGAPFGNGNTYPQVYDALGRRVTLSVTAKF